MSVSEAQVSIRRVRLWAGCHASEWQLLKRKRVFIDLSVVTSTKAGGSAHLKPITGSQSGLLAFFFFFFFAFPPDLMMSEAAGSFVSIPPPLSLSASLSVTLRARTRVRVETPGGSSHYGATGLLRSLAWTIPTEPAVIDRAWGCPLE